MKLKMALLGLMLTLFSVSMAGATTYTFSAGDLGDLDHGYAYKWGIDWSLPDGETIVGASLFFNDIRDWAWEENDLYVDLLPWAREGVRSYRDYQASGDFFSGRGISLIHYEDLPNYAQDLTYNFVDSDLAALMAYSADGNFGIGFDPDCHFYNNGISLNIETATTPVPAQVFTGWK